MELVRGIHNIRAQHRGCALTIGNFDGVHLGHQKVIKSLVVEARERGLPAAVMLFEPQPRELFAKQQAPARICRFREKYEQLKGLGVDRLICVRFNQRFAEQSAEFFVNDLLVQGLGVKFLVVGDDFQFGRQRQGNYQTLKFAGEQYGFEVRPTSSLCLAEQRVSSTLIRQHLAEGDFSKVSELMGRPFRFTGRVIHGEKLGRQLGFATANLKVARWVSPLSGVFAVKVSLGSEQGEEQTYSAVANIGWRPTAKGKSLLVEAHLFDFNQNIYGQRIEVEPQLKLRNEQKFASLEQLTQQVEKDIVAAKAYYGLV